MQPNWGEPPWARCVAPSQAPISTEPDVAVVGGGLTGLSAAYHLASRGVRTVVLEAHRLGDGASGRTGAIVLEGTAAGILEGTGECIPTLGRLVSELGIDCDLRTDGCWEISHRESPGARTLPWLDDGSEVRIVGTVAGGTIDPTKLISGLAQAAARAGAEIHQGARVERVGLEHRPQLEIDGAVLRPRSVVVALNAWTGSLLANTRPLRAALTFACATEPLTADALREIGLGEGMPFYTVDLPYLWGRELSDRRVIFGGGLAFASPRDLERVDIASADSTEVLGRLEARVQQLHPALNKIRFSARWAGPIAFSSDVVPLLGSLPDAPTVFVAGGYAGHGVALSVWAGRAIARAIVDGQPLPAWGRVT